MEFRYTDGDGDGDTPKEPFDETKQKLLDYRYCHGHRYFHAHGEAAI